MRKKLLIIMIFLSMLLSVVINFSQDISYRAEDDGEIEFHCIEEEKLG